MERLQKLLAQAGIASRRRAEEMITAGRVRVNGKVVTELGAQADPERDTIMVDNHPVALETKAYYVLNKPRGYISDRDDTAGNKTALDLVPEGRRLFSAGRLDLMSEGMLLLTNDGELANRLTHPRYEHEKEYFALVFGSPDDKVIERLERGILYDGEWLRADSAARAARSQPFGEAGRDETWVRLVLHEGKKRQIRHMCASLGHPVKRLVRVRIGPLKLGTLKLGEWRKLTPDELKQLRNSTPRKSGGKPSSRRAGSQEVYTGKEPGAGTDRKTTGKGEPERRGAPARKAAPYREGGKPTGKGESERQSAIGRKPTQFRTGGKPTGKGEPERQSAPGRKAAPFRAGGKPIGRRGLDQRSTVRRKPVPFKTGNNLRGRGKPTSFRPEGGPAGRKPRSKNRKSESGNQQ